MPTIGALRTIDPVEPENVGATALGEANAPPSEPRRSQLLPWGRPGLLEARLA